MMNSSSNNEVVYLDESGRHENGNHEHSDDFETSEQTTQRDRGSAGNGNTRQLDRAALSKLPVSHLVRHFLLFAFSALFLLTMARAGYTLWQISNFESVGVLISSFLMGLRFDLALVGMLLAVPVFLVPILSISRFTRGIARFFSVTWMILALVVVLLLELLTPYTLQQQGLRPDMAVLGAIGDPLDLLSQLWSKYIIPAVIGIILSLLIFAAFTARLDINRFLRHPIRVIPALCLSFMGLALCIVVATGSANPPGLGFGPHEAQISGSQIVNEITMNSAFKTVRSLFPF